MSENEKLSPILTKNNPWVDNENNIWLGSTVGLIRNVEKFNFPGKLEVDRRKQLLTLMSKEFLTVDGLETPFFFKAEEVDPAEKEYLFERFLSNQNFNQAHVGEAFVLDGSGQFIATLNLRDHIQMTYIDCKGELESTWNKLVKIETSLGKLVSFAFSSKFGFLTSDPGLCGTALTASIFLQLPALVHTEKLDETLDKYADDSLNFTGIQGNPTEIIGDILVIQNNFTLGVTEENIISNLRSFVTKMLIEENSLRNQMRQVENADVKDRVSRAFGILIHSYQIEAIEALNAISLLKLGVDMGWITGVSMAKLNQLFFNCRRSHLLYQIPKKIPQEEIPHKRAEFIHETLKDMHLTI